MVSNVHHLIGVGTVIEDWSANVVLEMDVECTNCTCGGEGIQVVCVFCTKTSLCG